MRPLLAALILSCAAHPAAALSCMRPSVEGTFARADADPRPYVLAVGTLSPMPGEAPPRRRSLAEDGVPYGLRTELTGHLATLGGFDRAATVPVTVEVGCAGPWCGGMPEGEQLLFLELRDGAYVLEAGPCPSFAFPDTAEARETALSCLRGEGCEAPPDM